MNMDQPRKRLFPKGQVLVFGLVFSMLLVGASLVAPVLPGGSRIANVAHASGGGAPSATITIASPATLSGARTMVLVSGTYSCSTGGETLLVGFVSVELFQAGRQIVASSGSFNFFDCPQTNGIPTIINFQIAVTPFGGSAPFHGGRAVAVGTITLNFASGLSFVASTGNQVISIKG